MMPDERKEKSLQSIGQAIREIAQYSGLVLQLIVTVVLFWFIGKIVDQRYGTSPLFMIIGVMFGITVGMYNFIKSVIELGKKKDKSEGEN